MNESFLSVVLVLEGQVHQSSLRAMLDSTAALRVAGSVQDCQSALSIVQEVHPDFVLIAANLPESEIIAFLRVVHDSEPHTRVVVLRKIPWHRSHLLDAGATAVLSQDSSVSELLSAFNSETS